MPGVYKNTKEVSHSLALKRESAIKALSRSQPNNLYFRPYDGAHAGALGGLMEAWGTVHSVAVAEGEHRIAEPCRARDQIFRQGGAGQEAESAAAAELDVI